MSRGSLRGAGRPRRLIAVSNGGSRDAAFERGERLLNGSSLRRENHHDSPVEIVATEHGPSLNTGLFIREAHVIDPACGVTRRKIVEAGLLVLVNNDRLVVHEIGQFPFVRRTTLRDLGLDALAFGHRLSQQAFFFVTELDEALELYFLAVLFEHIDDEFTNYASRLGACRPVNAQGVEKTKAALERIHV